MTTSDQFALEPLPGLVHLEAPSVHHVQALSTSAGTLTVTTLAQPWSYAVSFDVNHPCQASSLSLVTQAPCGVGGRVLIRVSGWVSSGRVGVCLIDGASGALLAEVFRTPADGLTEFDLWAGSLAGCQTVVIRNATEGPSTVTIESIRAYRSPGVTRPVRVSWIEHRRTTVNVPDYARDDHSYPSGPDVAWAPVSIVLTVKNGMPYLPEAIDSLRRQRYRNFELIVQDGASTDGTLAYLRGITDFPISIVSEPDTGIGEARSRAYARCRTDLVGSIDADNLLAPEALATAVAVFRQHPDAAAVYGAVELINADGSTNSLFVPPEFDLLKVIANELVPPWSTAFFSRRVCGPHLFFDPDIPGCVDYDSWLRIGHLPILQVTEVLGRTRFGTQSVSCGIGNYDEFCTEKIRALERYVQRIEPAALQVAVLRHGITGIYCWTAESLRRLGAEPTEVERYIALALATKPTSERARQLRATQPWSATHI